MDINDELDALYNSLTGSVSQEEACHPTLGWWYWRRGALTATVYRDKDGKIHRGNGPAIICPQLKHEEWYKHGVIHRIGGPAKTFRYYQWWYKDGLLHREDGPALIDDAGPNQYWLNGSKLSPKQYKKEISRRVRKGLIK